MGYWMGGGGIGLDHSLEKISQTWGKMLVNLSVFLMWPGMPKMSFSFHKEEVSSIFFSIITQACKIEGQKNFLQNYVGFI